MSSIPYFKSACNAALDPNIEKGGYIRKIIIIIIIIIRCVGTYVYMDV